MPLLELVFQVAFHVVTSFERGSVLGFLIEVFGEAWGTSPSPDVGSKDNHLHAHLVGIGEP